MASRCGVSPREPLQGLQAGQARVPQCYQDEGACWPDWYLHPGCTPHTPTVPDRSGTQCQPLYQADNIMLYSSAGSSCVINVTVMQSFNIPIPIRACVCCILCVVAGPCATTQHHLSSCLMCMCSENSCLNIRVLFVKCETGIRLLLSFSGMQGAQQERFTCVSLGRQRQKRGTALCQAIWTTQPLPPSPSSPPHPSPGTLRLESTSPTGVNHKR